MYRLSKSQHFYDRRFEIILWVNEVNGPLLTGGHPECLDEIIRVNLKNAAEEGRPVLSGVIRPGKWVNAWVAGSVESEKHLCLVYEGHVAESVSDEMAREALNRLAVNLGTYLQSPNIRVSLGGEVLVFSFEKEQLATTG